MHPITIAIRTQSERTAQMEHSSPLFLTSSFTYHDAEDMRAAFADENDANIYTRFSNPTVQEFIGKICVLEGAEEGFATASGMSAIFASFMALLKAGDHLISCKSIFSHDEFIIDFATEVVFINHVCMIFIRDKPNFGQH